MFNKRNKAYKAFKAEVLRVFKSQLEEAETVLGMNLDASMELGPWTGLSPNQAIAALEGEDKDHNFDRFVVFAAIYYMHGADGRPTFDKIVGELKNAK